MRADDPTTGARRRVAIVPHTHWDREWYHPFQSFRLKLVRLIDDLLDLMEQDSSYRHFLLDGQLAMIDDYLEIRPQNEGRLRALAAAGRPRSDPGTSSWTSSWCPARRSSGISRRASCVRSSFGAVMEVGYLPDMFGHVAQMPQLLAQAGLGHAVVWRGVPPRSTAPPSSGRPRTARASGPSTSSPATATGRCCPRTPSSCCSVWRPGRTSSTSFLPEGPPMLVMNGSDHLRPQPWPAGWWPRPTSSRTNSRRR